MKTWVWTEEFIDERICTVEADTWDEALTKRGSGDWASEDTINFYSRGVTREMKEE